VSRSPVEICVLPKATRVRRQHVKLTAQDQDFSLQGDLRSDSPTMTYNQPAEDPPSDNDRPIHGLPSEHFGFPVAAPSGGTLSAGRILSEQGGDLGSVRAA